MQRREKFQCLSSEGKTLFSCSGDFSYSKASEVAVLDTCCYQLQWFLTETVRHSTEHNQASKAASKSFEPRKTEHIWILALWSVIYIYCILYFKMLIKSCSLNGFKRVNSKCNYVQYWVCKNYFSERDDLSIDFEMLVSTMMSYDIQSSVHIYYCVRCTSVHFKNNSVLY